MGIDVAETDCCPSKTWHLFIYIVCTVSCSESFYGRTELHLKKRTQDYARFFKWVRNEDECKLTCLEEEKCKMVFYLQGGYSSLKHECYFLSDKLDNTDTTKFRTLKPTENERFISYRPDKCLNSWHCCSWCIAAALDNNIFHSLNALYTFKHYFRFFQTLLVLLNWE